MYSYFKKDNKLLQDRVRNIFAIKLFNYNYSNSIMCVNAIYNASHNVTYTVHNI